MSYSDDAKHALNALGLDEKATYTSEEVNQAYRKKAKEYHPDRNLGDEAAKVKYARVDEAKTLLDKGMEKGTLDRIGYSDVRGAVKAEVPQIAQTLERGAGQAAARASNPMVEAWGQLIRNAADRGINFFAPTTKRPIHQTAEAAVPAPSYIAPPKDLPKPRVNVPVIEVPVVKPKPRGSLEEEFANMEREMLNNADAMVQDAQRKVERADSWVQKTSANATSKLNPAKSLEQASQKAGAAEARMGGEAAKFAERVAVVAEKAGAVIKGGLR